MLIKPGEKVFVVTRRMFECDLRRHFVGEVSECSETAFRAIGYVYIFNEMDGNFTKREELRTRIFSLSDSGYIINILPKDTHLENIVYQVGKNNQRFISDDHEFMMDVSEFSTRL